MTQTPSQRAGFGIAHWKRKATELRRENRELKIERDLWKAEALRLSRELEEQITCKESTT